MLTTGNLWQYLVPRIGIVFKEHGCEHVVGDFTSGWCCFGGTGIRLRDIGWFECFAAKGDYGLLSKYLDQVSYACRMSGWTP